MMLKTFTTLTIILLLSSFINNPHGEMADMALIESKSVNVFVDECCASIFNIANYNEENSMLEFITNEVISFVQIYSIDNELEFQLNIMSNKVMISKSLFSIGESRLAFMVQDSNEIHFTDVFIPE